MLKALGQKLGRLWRSPAADRGGGSRYVPEMAGDVSAEDLWVRLIAFYLPQFHPIPENDEWWGRGFTEWTNVVGATPQFEGHEQPRQPDTLGYYDLRRPEVQREQIRLARKHGIHGFCYHYYWFDGRKLLDGPLRQVLADPSLDLPFCICWANENWTRSWDGKDDHVLVAQNHSPESDLAFIAEMETLFHDPRYITVGDRPLLVVYRPQLFPDPAATAERWREYFRARGLPDPFLVNAHSFPDPIAPGTIGFDASVEFPPHQYPLRGATEGVGLLSPDFEGAVYDYRACVEEAEARVSQARPFDLFPAVMAAWDNTARRGSHATVFANAAPEEYRRWMVAACRRAMELEPERRLVFINAWNEWGEGAYLEPDRRYGHALLQATAEAALSVARRRGPGPDSRAD